MIRQILKKQKEKGFTLIELLIYSALLAILAVASITIFLQIVDLMESSRRNRESLDNARRAMDVIVQEIKHAKSVYSPTSVFNTHPGQLSLETLRDLPADENSTYVDIYLDDGQVFLKREGSTAQQITADKVIISQLIFTLVNTGTGNPAVRVDMAVDYKDPFSGYKNEVNLVSTTALRDYD